MKSEMEQVIIDNREISGIEDFYRYRGFFKNGIKTVCFLMGTGITQVGVQEILRLDALGESEKNAVIYTRLGQLQQMKKEETSEYVAFYEKWEESGFSCLNTRKFHRHTLVSLTFEKAFTDTVLQLEKLRGGFGMTASIKKNIGIKFMYWLDQVFETIPVEWDESQVVKVVAEDMEKTHEYFFFYFLTQLGINVLLLENRKKVAPSIKQMGLHKELFLGGSDSDGGVSIPAYKNSNKREDFEIAGRVSQEENTGRIIASSEGFVSNRQVQTSSGQKENSPRPTLKIPEHPKRKKKDRLEQIPAAQASSFTTGQQQTEFVRQPQRERQNENLRREKSFEELANLASSVVMIAVHDGSGEVVGTGSGIMIGRKGFILTNHHVVSRGVSFSVRIEDDETVYRTDEVIKYNHVCDLAVIRIQRELVPLPLYEGREPLVRGQKDVAIGSPLG